MSNRLVLNETSYHGKGAIQEIAGEVKRRGFKKAFVCSGPTIFKHGVTKKVTDVLEQAGCAYEVYTNIKENPTIENVQTGVKAYKESGADFIVAIGGGSPMDTAKAIGIITVSYTHLSDACNGTERSRCYRYCSCSRNFHGYFRSILSC